jgi:hypothetical protein
MAIKARSSGYPFASKTNGNEELLQSFAPGPVFPLQMIYGLSGTGAESAQSTLNITLVLPLRLTRYISPPEGTAIYSFWTARKWSTLYCYSTRVPTTEEPDASTAPQPEQQPGVKRYRNEQPNLC